MKTINVKPKDQLQELFYGIEEALPIVTLESKFEESYKRDLPLQIKFGADPSRPDIHLGHAVVLHKLRLLQDFGHDVQFIIGDFTAMIGDPTGRNKARPELTKDEVLINAKSYKQQVFQILDKKKTKVFFNSKWLSKLSVMDLIRLLSLKTVQQLLAREDFSNRLKDEVPIYLHEFVYPVLQGYDSVVLRSDIEFGGVDQKFNLLVGREMQKAHGISEQGIILLPLLEGLDGVKKMSKSFDNYIGFNDSSRDIFGKVMSISDPLMKRYYELLSQRGSVEIQRILTDLDRDSLHPMQAKKDLAEELTAQFCGKKASLEARSGFEQVFSHKKAPTDLKTIEVESKGQPIDLLAIMVDQTFCKSRSEARRLIQQGGVRIDGLSVDKELLPVMVGKEYLLRVGKLNQVYLRVRS